jgi:hypothetical protein
MENVLGFVEMLTASYEDYKRLPPSHLKHFIAMGGKVAKLFGKSDKDSTS